MTVLEAQPLDAVEAVTAGANCFPGRTIDWIGDPPAPAFGLVPTLERAGLLTRDSATAGQAVHFRTNKAGGGVAFDAYKARSGDPTADIKNVFNWPRGPDAHFEPFGLMAGDACTPAIQIEYLDRAIALLQRNQSHLVAGEFWDGGVTRQWLTDTPPVSFLADGTAVDAGTNVRGKAVCGIAEGIGALEVYAGNVYPGARVWIYMSSLVAQVATTALALHREGLALYTHSEDSVVVSDDSFPLTGDLAGGTPAAPGANQAWIYATATPRIELGPIMTMGLNRQSSPQFWEAFRVSDNTAAAIAEQAALFYFDPQLHAKVLVDLTKPLVA